MENEQLTINVRSPSLSETLVVTASMNDAVSTIKRSLQSIHPSNPDVGSQRLIYAGKLLRDNDTLDSILNKVNESNVYIFHLVVKPSGMNTVSQPRQQVPVKTVPLEPPKVEQEIQTSVKEVAIPPVETPIPSKSSTPIPTPSGTSQRSSPTPSPSISETTPGNSNIPNASEQVPRDTATGLYQIPQIVTIDGKQYLAITPAIQSQLEAYEQYILAYQQYYTQWYQWYNANYMFNETTGVHGVPSSSPPSSATPSSPANGNRDQPTPTTPVNAAVDAEAERQRAARRAAFVWLAAKLMLVAFILTRNASIPRMILLYVSAFVFLLYQTGQLRFIIRRVRPWNTEARAFNLARDANGTASDQPITRRRIIERGVYTFVASLFPSYGHDPRIAEAFDNAQQDEPIAGI